MKNTTSFIETQFPVSKISKESYKERKAVQGQTLTGLGKWWGRKPLILVRATILGLLMPSTDDPKRDQEIFLKILTMDESGFELRKYKQPSPYDVYEQLTDEEQKKYFSKNNGKVSFKDSLSRDQQIDIKDMVFRRMSYDDRLKYSKRPEEVELTNKDSWSEINKHLGTKANNLQELVQQLSQKRFGHTAKIGDCFAGGGSVPFEAARMGCDAFGSDLNPIAGLLTWASLNIAGANDETIDKLRSFQEKIYIQVDKQIIDWGIEHNEEGHRANAYLYCVETICPECNWMIPLSPSWRIGIGSKTIAKLIENTTTKCFDFQIETNVSKDELKKSDSSGSIRGNNLLCPHCLKETPIAVIRGDKRGSENGSEFGLRLWEKDEFHPRKDDVFQERLYCIRYEDKSGKRYYTAPSEKDLEREQKVVNILTENFSEWQEKGYIPSDRIKSGYNTDQVIRERGWQYWHQLFNPRQILINALFIKHLLTTDDEINVVSGILGINRIADWNSKLCRWGVGQARESAAQTFYNQAFNTFYNYPTRALGLLKNTWKLSITNKEIHNKKDVEISDARAVDVTTDFWITDPPYADAINYHELSEFFLSWDKAPIKQVFPKWYVDSKRALAVQGTGENFRTSMVEVYTNLAQHMNPSGRQVVMFTHQDPAVWAELATILWAAGLQVTSAWNIATETSALGIKSGNYVQGTVIMVLKKQNSDTVGYLDEVAPLIEEEVKTQIETMRDLDDKDDPNFSDADYLLAAYAASLKVLTSYKEFKEINLQHELNRSKDTKEKSEIQKIIEEAVRTAYDQLIPRDFDTFAWKSLQPIERFYIRGLELEKEGIQKMSAYQELARGFGVANYTELMASTTANQARLKTPAEFGDRMLGDTNEFGKTLIRQVLKSLEVAVKDEQPSAGKQWLKTEVKDYWPHRSQILTLLKYLTTLESYESLTHWSEAAEQAPFVRSLVEQDGV